MVTVYNKALDEQREAGIKEGKKAGIKEGKRAGIKEGQKYNVPINVDTIKEGYPILCT